MTRTATDLLTMVRTQNTAQLITQHALAEAMLDGSGSGGAAIMLTIETIETVLGERGIASCPGCGTLSDAHAEYCR